MDFDRGEGKFEELNLPWKVIPSWMYIIIYNHFSFKRKLFIGLIKSKIRKIIGVIVILCHFTDMVSLAKKKKFF